MRHPVVLKPNIQGFKYYSLNELTPHNDTLKITNGQTVIKDINTSAVPAVIKNEDNTIKVTYSNCGEIFIKAPRCPL